MSKTPVLTAAQQRQTLSAKKKPPRASLKNVLAQPYDRHWPEISAAEAQQLVEAIGAVRLDADDAQTAWKSSHCIRGLNETLRHLQSDPHSQPARIEILLLSADIRPKFIVEQVLVLAAGRSGSRQTRCLLLPGLRDLLSAPQSLGLPACMCVSLADVGAVPAFRAVAQLVEQLCAQHPAPPEAWQPPRARKRRLQPTEAPKPARKSALPAIDFDELYVRRPTTDPSATAPQKRRTFVPAGTVFRSQAASSDWSDYISLRSNTSAAATATAVVRKPAGAAINLSAIEKMKRKMQLPGSAKPVGAGYVTLSVNRVQGNPNKVRNNGGPKNGAGQKRK